jgi:hypothetical protein
MIKCASNKFDIVLLVICQLNPKNMKGTGQGGCFRIALVPLCPQIHMNNSIQNQGIQNLPFNPASFINFCKCLMHVSITPKTRKGYKINFIEGAGYRISKENYNEYFCIALHVKMHFCAINTCSQWNNCFVTKRE